MKRIDLRHTVYELVTANPEVADIMATLGFEEMRNSLMLNTAGRLTTIPMGAKLKSVPLDSIIKAFQEKGYEVIGHELADSATGNAASHTIADHTAASCTTATGTHACGCGAPDTATRKSLLKAYLKRLNDGENLESVRKDFVANFEHVDASEIMSAEQELIAEGTPITEIQRLCDLHSALFHGCTSEEKVVPILNFTGETLKTDHGVSKETSSQLADIPGHPLHTFTLENKNLEKLVVTAKEAVEKRENVDEILPKIREVSIHYAKKGDLIYPHLKVKYDISGPSSVMWTIDDEIRDGLAALAKKADRDADWYNQFSEILTRMEEMIYKEINILFPVCTTHFAPEEWIKIYHDSKDYAPCLGVTPATWEKAESHPLPAPMHVSSASGSCCTGETKAHSRGGCGCSTTVGITANAVPTQNGTLPPTAEIVMPGGHMTVEQLTAMLNTIPIEITFVDENDINRYFNEGPKVFKRPTMAIDRDVYSCHPPKIETMVRAIIDDFRNGKRDSVPIWMEKQGITFLVTYYAVRDRAGKFLGTLELVQDMEHAKEHFLKQK